MIVNIGRRKAIVTFEAISQSDPQYDRRFATTCTLMDDGHRCFVGIAVKSPNDRFCRLTGQKIALKRAFEQMYRATPSLAKEDFSHAYEKVRVKVFGAEPE